jgi:hypothetical protein
MSEHYDLTVSIIIPCFNEEQVIMYTYERVSKTMQSFGLRVMKSFLSTMAVVTARYLF